MRKTAAVLIVLLSMFLLLPASAHHRPWHKTTTTTTTTTTTPATSTTTTVDLTAVACSTAPDGAPSGSPVRGPTTYTTSRTITNVVFDGNHSDDLVRVYGAHVIFDHVTFKGTGTGSTGHTVEVKRGGSVEIRNSLWNGRPSEDSIQFGGSNGDQHGGRSVIRCSTIGGTPGEDHIDLKVSLPGAVVDFVDNRIVTGTPGGRTIQNDGSVGVQHFVRNGSLTNILLEHTNNGTISGSNIGQLYIYDAKNWLIQANTIGKVGHGVSNGSRVPTGIYYRSNTLNQFEFYGGSCWASGNSRDITPPCTSGSPSWYPR